MRTVSWHPGQDRAAAERACGQTSPAQHRAPSSQKHPSTQPRIFLLDSVEKTGREGLALAHGGTDWSLQGDGSSDPVGVGTALDSTPMASFWGHWDPATHGWHPLHMRPLVVPPDDIETPRGPRLCAGEVARPSHGRVPSLGTTAALGREGSGTLSPCCGHTVQASVPGAEPSMARALSPLRPWGAQQRACLWESLPQWGHLPGISLPAHTPQDGGASGPVLWAQGHAGRCPADLRPLVQLRPQLQPEDPLPQVPAGLPAPGVGYLAPGGLPWAPGAATCATRGPVSRPGSQEGSQLRIPGLRQWGLCPF